MLVNVSVFFFFFFFFLISETNAATLVNVSLVLITKIDAEMLVNVSGSLNK